MSRVIRVFTEQSPTNLGEEIILPASESTHLARVLRIKEGDPLSPQDIKRSRDRLNNLGFFKNVEIKHEKIPSSNNVNLIVELEENQTGQLSFGFGYSTTDSLTTNFGKKRPAVGFTFDLRSLLFVG